MIRRILIIVSLQSLVLLAAPPFPPTVSLIGDSPTLVDLSAYNLQSRWSIADIPPEIIGEIRGDTLSLRHGKDTGINFGLVKLVSDRGRVLYIPFAREPLHTVEFSYHPPRGVANTVSVAGSFNGWNADKNPLKKDTRGGFRVSLHLPPGSYQYKLVVDGQWIADPSNPNRVDNGLGSFNSALELPTGFSEIGFSKWSYNEGKLSFLLNPPDSPDPGQIVVLNDGAKHEYNWDHPYLTVADTDGRLLRILGTDHEGKPLKPCWVLLDEGVPRGMKGSESGIYDTFLYSLFPDRFRNGDTENDRSLCDTRVHPRIGYQGGDLSGILATLEEGYFDSLGINTIWMGPLYPGPSKAAISPLEYTDEMRAMERDTLDSLLLSMVDPYFGTFETPLSPDEFPEAMAYAGYHGYWPAGDRTVEPRFGSVELMKQLTRSIHDRGYRVLLDLVPHHVHEEHPWFTQHPEWFQPLLLNDGKMNLRHWDAHRLTTWFDPYLPTLDLTTESEAVDSVVASAVWWLQAFDLDGFRHDATKHIPHSFWRSLTTGLLKAEKDDQIIQIGETFGSRELVGSYVCPAEMDGQFDFNLYYASRPLFAGVETASFTQVAREIEQSLRAYGPLHLMANITGSHDQPRFITLAQGDIPSGANERSWGWLNDAVVHDPTSYTRLQLFFLFNVSIPGTPVLYYGDEIGMPGAGDPDNRRFMRFGSDLSDVEREHLAVMRTIGTMRKNMLSLAFGDYVLLAADEHILIYARTFFDETAVIGFNIDPDSAWTGSVSFAALPGMEHPEVRFGQDSIVMDGNTATLTLPSLSGLVLTGGAITEGS